MTIVSLLVTFEELIMNHNEGNLIAGEVEYGGMNDCLFMLNEEHDAKWFDYYLDYVEFLND